MKVFISWSGTTSHKVATVLRDWLPSVVQSVEPYVSSEDIDKGARWSTDIAGELDQSGFGILCVTKDNVNAPWLNFEAGALGKSVDKSRVCPFLFRIKRSEVTGPILQFQSTVFEKDDVLKLLKSVNACCIEQALDEARLEKTFDVWWPSLKKDLDVIPEETQQEGHEKKPAARSGNHMDAILEEVLELSRLNQKLLRSPEELLPPQYLDKVINRTAIRVSDLTERLEHPAFNDLIIRYLEFLREFRMFYEAHKRVSGIEKLREAASRIRNPLRYVIKNFTLGFDHLPSRLMDEL